MEEQVTDLTPEREQEIRELIEDNLGRDDVCPRTECWAPAVSQTAECARDLLAALDAERARREVAEGTLVDLRRQMEEARADGNWPLAKVVAERDAERARSDRELWRVYGEMMDLQARNRNLEAVAEAARTLHALHRDVLGLPTISQDNLDAAVEAWAALRAALAVLEEPPA